MLFPAHQERTQGGWGGVVLVCSPPKARFQNTYFVDTMISRDLTFSRNQPLESADD